MLGSKWTSACGFGCIWNFDITAVPRFRQDLTTVPRNTTLLGRVVAVLDDISTERKLLAITIFLQTKRYIVFGQISIIPTLIKKRIQGNLLL